MTKVVSNGLVNNSMSLLIQFVALKGRNNCLRKICRWRNSDTYKIFRSVDGKIQDEFHFPLLLILDSTSYELLVVPPTTYGHNKNIEQTISL
jgi:hypothetical protein